MDEVPDWPEISRAIKRAETQARQTRKRQIVYRLSGKISVIPHVTYRRLNLGAKGAERICTIG